MMAVRGIRREGMTFVVTWNKQIERAIANAPTEALNRLAEETAAEAIRRSPFKTGTNRRSIQWDSPRGGERRIFTTSGYGGFLEIGTGLYGPKKKRIVPKTKKALWWPGARHPVASVAGRPATPYMRPALEDVKRRAAAILKDLIK